MLIRAERQPFPAAEVTDSEAGGPMGVVTTVLPPYSHNYPLICIFFFYPLVSHSLHRVWHTLPLLHESSCLRGVVFIVVPHQLPTL